MSDSSSLQRDVEAEARRLLPDAVRRVEWLRHGDAPVIEPGELAPQFVLVEPPGMHGTDVHSMIKALQRAHAPALKRFRHELARRWPEIRHLGVAFEDDHGQRSGGMIQDVHDEREGHADRGIPVMVRLEAAELETVDRLITAGVAPTRAEALRWALGRLRQAGLQLLAAGRRGRREGAERTAPLVVILTAGQLVPGFLIEEQVLLGRLVHDPCNGPGVQDAPE